MLDIAYHHGRRNVQATHPGHCCRSQGSHATALRAATNHGPAFCAMQRLLESRWMHFCTVRVPAILTGLLAWGAPCLRRSSHSMSAPALDSTEQDPAWASLPAPALHDIFRLASAPQAPGCCLGAPVCSDWQSAAAACRGIHLLYAAGHELSDESFAAWLAKCSPQLEALTLSSSDSISLDVVLGALLKAAAAAVGAAEGAPLPLHTLRVLADGPDLDVMARLLAALPHLRCLQLDVYGSPVADYEPDPPTEMVHFIEALQQASQLQELYFCGPPEGTDSGRYIAEWLPSSLQRLSFRTTEVYDEAPDLSHLSKLSFLYLEDWEEQQEPLTAKLPPGLQQLELVTLPQMYLSELQQEQGILTRHTGGCAMDDSIKQLPSFTKIHTLSGFDGARVGEPSMLALLQQLPALSALGLLHYGEEPYTRQPQLSFMSAVGSLKHLRRLHLGVLSLEADPAGLAALSQLTRLVLTSDRQSHEQQQRAWVAELGRMAGLRWLSVPDVLLVADQAWLGGLQQLQVLVLSSAQGLLPGPQPREMLQQLVWQLEGCSPDMLPPRLLLLGFSNMPAWRAAAWQVRRRLRRLVCSSRCEVVVGIDLDEVADPMKQLAGLPVALRHALA